MENAKEHLILVFEIYFSVIANCRIVANYYPMMTLLLLDEQIIIKLKEMKEKKDDSDVK